jgi:hypothetical protein
LAEGAANVQIPHSASQAGVDFASACFVSVCLALRSSCRNALCLKISVQRREGGPIRGRLLVFWVYVDTKTDVGAQFIPVATNCGLSATVSGNDVTELKCDIA